MEKLTSLQNPRIKAVCRLRERHAREEEKKTILEGYRELTRAFEFGMKLDECFYCPSMFLGENEFPFLEKLKESGVNVAEVSEQVLSKMAYRDRPEGLIAVAFMMEHSLESLPPVKNGLYLIAEALEKPGNLGSILRSADAAGANGLIICDRCTDIYNPNTIRASTGALFSVPLAEANPEEVYNWLKANDIKVLAATPHTDHIYSEVDMTCPIAIAVGAEQYGLSDFWMKKADLQVNIPMLGKIDSLNVATAATILLYEAARQRKWKRAGA